jgi:hypothetical protein
MIKGAMEEPPGSTSPDAALFEKAAPSLKLNFLVI